VRRCPVTRRGGSEAPSARGPSSTWGMDMLAARQGQSERGHVRVREKDEADGRDGLGDPRHVGPRGAFYVASRRERCRLGVSKLQIRLTATAFFDLHRFYAY